MRNKLAEKPIIREATELDLVELCNNMRECDRKEVAATTTVPLEDAVMDSFRGSEDVWAATYKGHLLAVFGVAAGPEEGDFRVGIPWLLGTNAMDQWPVVVLRLSKGFLKVLVRPYDYLVNFVHAENTRSINWLKHLGFLVEESPVKWGIDDEPFLRFYMECSRGV